jgi:hypothetical protein
LSITSRVIPVAPLINVEITELVEGDQSTPIRLTLTRSSLRGFPLAADFANPWAR